MAVTNPNAKIESLGGYSYIVAVDCDLFHGSGEPIGGVRLQQLTNQIANEWVIQ